MLAWWLQCSYTAGDTGRHRCCYWLSRSPELKCYTTQHSLRLNMGLERTMTGAKYTFQIHFGFIKVWPGSQKKVDINKNTEAEGFNYALTTAGMRWLWKGKRKQGAGQFSHIVGAQRDPASAASAEFGLAIGAEVAAAIRKLGLAADTTGWGVVLLLGLLTPRLRPDPSHLLFVALKLLVQCSEREGQKRLPISGTLCTHKPYVLNFTLLQCSDCTISYIHKNKNTKWHEGISE